MCVFFFFSFLLLSLSSFYSSSDNSSSLAAVWHCGRATFGRVTLGEEGAVYEEEEEEEDAALRLDGTVRFKVDQILSFVTVC
jgi:hypothetical protein